MTGFCGGLGRSLPHSASIGFLDSALSLMPLGAVRGLGDRSHLRCGSRDRSRRCRLCRRSLASHSASLPRGSSETSKTFVSVSAAAWTVIAAVDHQHRGFLGDDGNAGRARKARQPLKALGSMRARIRLDVCRSAAREPRRSWLLPCRREAPSRVRQRARARTGNGMFAAWPEVLSVGTRGFQRRRRVNVDQPTIRSWRRSAKPWAR